MLLLTGLIWGVAFVAQSEGMNYVGAFTFNCCRFMIGGVMLIPCIFFLRSIGAGENGHVSRGQRQQQRHMAVIGGICCGLVICVASTLQQMGIAQTTVGKAGFITALYIVIVPVLGLFLGKSTGLNTSVWQLRLWECIFYVLRKDFPLDGEIFWYFYVLLDSRFIFW